MSSQIIETNPTSGSAKTSDVRDNFGFAKNEILELQRMTEDKVITTNGGSVNTQDATFTNIAVTLVEGTRVSVEIGTGLTTTNTTPTLNCNTTGDITIVRQDGSPLAAGDLKEGQYCDFVYAASGGSHIQNKWVWMNSPYDKLITDLKQAVMEQTYPVNSLFMTTQNYADSDAVATALGMSDVAGITFARYAEGRAIVGADLGTTITSASSSSNVVTLVVSSHAISAGDSITVSGFTSDTDANGSFTVTSTTSTNIVYTASNVSDGSLSGSNLLVINNAFDAGDTGGSSQNTISVTVPVTGYGTTGGSFGTPTSGRMVVGSGANEHGETLESLRQAANTRTLTDDVNVVQPYISTYIWKRTA